MCGSILDQSAPADGPDGAGDGFGEGGPRGALGGALGGEAGQPLWAAVSARLLTAMADGRLPDGARLPPERALAAEHGVAVGTLRRALADLEARGLLERRQGSGNYARRAGLSRALYGFFRLEPVAGAGEPTADLVSLERLAVPAGVPLGAPRAHRIRRVRRLGGTAAALEEVWLDHPGALSRADVGDSLYLSYRAALGVEVAATTDRLGVAPMPAWGPAGAGLVAGRPSGHARREARAADGALVEVSDTWFDPDRARYVTRQGRDAPGARA